MYTKDRSWAGGLDSSADGKLGENEASPRDVSKL